MMLSHRLYSNPLLHVLKRANFSIEKKLYVYDGGETNREGESGIWATIFGGSGLIGHYVGAKLGYIGSNLIFPITTEYKPHHSDEIKQLKLYASTGKSWVHRDMNFKDQAMIERMINNSNVVINLVGPRKYLKRREEFDYVNIEIPERIAHACKKKGVHRLIHFSAAGADHNSPSYDFQTKALGQESVLKIFPKATIFRPCPVYGFNDYFATNIERQFNFFLRKFCIVSDDCSALKQPINVLDIATCVLNALKLEHTKGKIYQLGGPNVLTYTEVYEVIFNFLRFRPRLAYIDPKILMFLAKYIYNWEFLSMEMIKKRTIDEIVKPSSNVGTIKDLLVEPVTMRNGIQTMFRDRVASFTGREEDFDA